MPTTDLAIAGLLNENRPEILTSSDSFWVKSGIDSSEINPEQEFIPEEFINITPDNETLSQPRTPSVKEKTPDVAIFEDEDKENMPQEILSASCSLSISLGPASSYPQRIIQFKGPIFANQETSLTHPDLEVILKWNPVSALKAWEDRTGRQTSQGRNVTRKNTSKGNQGKAKKAIKQGKCRLNLMTALPVTICKDQNLKRRVLPESASEQ